MRKMYQDEATAVFSQPHLML